METENLNKELAGILSRVIVSLYSGTSRVTRFDLDNISEFINKSTNQTQYYSTEEAISYLNVPRNKFFNEIKPKLKRIKKRGHKCIYYLKAELDELKR